MRDIKFRAWHNTTISGNFVMSPHDEIVKNCGAYLCDNDKFPNRVIMQFTGLQDKNGVDIYEGDIVGILFTRWPSQSKGDERSLEEYMESLEKVFPICFHKGAFQISGKGYCSNDIGYDDIECGKHGYIKVIGNIHSNPELLEQ